MTTTLIKQHAKNYLDTLNHNSTTRIQYGYILNDLITFLINNKYKKINTIRIEQFLQHNTSKNKRPSTHYFNLRLATLKSLFTYLEKHTIITPTQNPTKYIKTKKTQHTESTRTLTQSELHYILKHTHNTTNDALTILAHTGLRISELTSIRKNNLKKLTINNKQTWVLTINTKGNKIRRLQLHNTTAHILNKRFKKYQYLANTPAFPSTQIKGNTMTPTNLRRIIKKDLKRIGFPNVTPHWLRHTFAQLLQLQNNQTHHIQQALGHTHLNTTQHYITQLQIIQPHIKIN